MKPMRSFWQDSEMVYAVWSPSKHWFYWQRCTAAQYCHCSSVRTNSNIKLANDICSQDGYCWLFILRVSTLNTLLMHRCLSTEHKRYWNTPAAYLICRSVCVSVCPESVLWQNGWLDPDAIWNGEWGQLRDGCIRWGWWSSKGKGQFWEWIWGIPL